MRWPFGWSAISALVFTLGAALIAWLLLLLITVAIGGCGNRDEGMIAVVAETPAPDNRVRFTWDASDTGEARRISSEGLLGYEICWSIFEESFHPDGPWPGQGTWEWTMACVDIPDTQRATVEMPEGHWYVSVRARYDTGYKTRFSNVIDVHVGGQIAQPIESRQSLR